MRSSTALNSNKKLTLPLPTIYRKKYVRKTDSSKGTLSKPSKLSKISFNGDPPNPPSNNRVPPQRDEVDEEATRPIKDYYMPTRNHNKSSIKVPATNAHTKLKTSYMHEVQRNKKDLPGENLQVHLSNFPIISDFI